MQTTSTAVTTPPAPPPRHVDISVPTLSGHVLRVSYNTQDGSFHASVNTRPSTDRDALQVAFLGGDHRGSPPRLRAPMGKHDSHVFWLESAAVDIPPQSAKRLRAWLDSLPASAAAGALS